jgi:hypothetical protein
MAPVSDTCYKQQAVIEFLVAEKEILGNIHKRLCAAYGSCAVDRSTAERWVQRVKASGNGETELHDGPWSGRPATASSTPMTSMRISASQVGNWPYSFQSAMELQWQLLTLWDI